MYTCTSMLCLCSMHACTLSNCSAAFAQLFSPASSGVAFRDASRTTPRKLAGNLILSGAAAITTQGPQPCKLDARLDHTLRLLLFSDPRTLTPTS